MDALTRRLDLVEELVTVAGRELRLLRPRSSEALLHEEAFEREEFLPYWAELWPSGLALARAVELLDLAGRRVLELGCGLAVPSFAAALGGADALATDWSPDAIELVGVNTERNGVPLQAARASWDEPAALLAGAPWDVVLAADVLYERRNAESLARLLPLLVDSAGAMLIADPGRPAAHAFFDAVASDGWRADERPAAPGGPPAVMRLRPSRGP